MLKFIGGRAIEALFTLWVVSVVVFVLVRSTGSPVDLLLPEIAGREERDQAIRALGLDRPLHVQYWTYLTNLLRGDLGRSYLLRVDVAPLLMDRLWNTVLLATAAMLVGIAIALPLGILAAANRGGLWDKVATTIALLGMAMPTFITGIVGIIVFGVVLRWLPFLGMGSPMHFILPAVTLGWFSSAGILRLLRSSLLEVLDADFIRVARSKGLGERYIMLVHALRNAMLPVLTFIGFSYGILLAGAITTESVFVWPGIGRLAFDSIVTRDFTVLQGITLVSAAIIILVNFVVDVLYGVLDPRIRR